MQGLKDLTQNNARVTRDQEVTSCLEYRGTSYEQSSTLISEYFHTYSHLY